MPIRLLAALAAFFAASLGIADAAPSPLSAAKIQEIDAFVVDAMAELKVPGVAIALVEDGKIIHTRGFGVVVEGGPEVSERTPFNVGSITKPFTAMAILHLMESGKLGLDDQVTDHIAWFATADKELSQGITIRHLLSHRSGFSTLTGNRNQASRDGGPKALEDAVRSLVGVRLTAHPGELYQYSNANFQILGLLIEVLSGEPYEVYVTTNLLGPMGMTDSYVGGASGGDQAPAIGHRYWFGQPRPYDGAERRAIVAQGGVRASSRDLAKFLLAHLDASVSPLSEESLTMSLQPYDGDTPMGYGLGWFVRDFADYRLVFHTGSNPGFDAAAGFSSDGRFGFVVLANAFNALGTRNVAALTRGVGDLVMDRSPAPVSPPITDRVAFILMCIVPIAIIWLGLGFLRKFTGARLAPLSRSGLLGWGWRLILPSFLLFGLAYFLYFSVPALNGAPMPAVRLYNPDIALLLQLGAGLALASGSLRFLLRVSIRS